jgi:hypothetical protein
VNAPLNPSLLALPHEVRELVLRVAEAVRLDAAIAARGDVLSLQKNGQHREAVAAHESAHSAVMRIDIYKVVAEFTGEQPDVAEQAAFEAAAKAANFNAIRNVKGEFVHPITWRAHTVWLAAVRWARKTDRPP